MSATKIQVRRDLASNWTSENPVLNAGEFGLDLTSMKLKIGDGSSTWSSLSYIDDDGPTLSSGSTEPTGGSHGDLFVNTSTCPPVLFIYSSPSSCPDDAGWNPVGVEGNIDEVNIYPLNVTPQPEDSVSLTVVPVGITTILPDSLITYTWYQYDNLTGGIGTQLKTTVSGSAITDTYTPVGNDMDKYIGCTIQYLGEVVTETTRATIGTAGVPVARMNGLRFDPNRNTNFRGTINSALGDYTVSCWVKRCDTDSEARLFVIDNGLNGLERSYSQILYKGTGRIAYGNFDTLIGESTGPVLEDNTWNHVVVSVTSSEVKFYLNGEDRSPGGIGPVDVSAANMVYLGMDTGGSSILDGYVSDVYFIDGRALEPTVFGQEFTLGWGPLDNSVVLENIGVGPTSPYDTRDNMDEKWSDYGDNKASASGYGWEQAFNGDVSTDNGTLDNTGTDAVWTAPAGLTITKSLRLNLENGASTGDCTVTYSDDSTQTFNTISFAGWVEATLPTYPGTIKKITIGNNSQSYSYLRGVEVDGRVLVDGPADNSQKWSESTTPSSYNFQFPYERAFDGVVTGDGGTDGFAGWADGVGDVTISFPPGVYANNKVEIWSGEGQANNHSITLNFVGGSSSTSTPEAAFISKKTFNNNGELLSFSMTRNGGGVRFYGIAIDGELLVDGGAQWNTSEVWSATANGNVINEIQQMDAAFDGSTSSVMSWYSTGSTSDGNAPYIEWTLETPITDVKKVRVSMYRSPEGNNSFSINSDAYQVSNLDQMWMTVYDNAVGITLTDFKIQSIGEAVSINLMAVEVNGQILVDAGSFGTSGFYLPFDPEASGVKYSSNTDFTRWYEGSEPNYMFDGDFATRAYTKANGELTYIDLGQITVNESIEAYGVCGSTVDGGPDWVVTVDGTDYPFSNTPVSPAEWVTIPGLTFPCTLEAVGNNYSGGCRAIRVDGKILVDHNNIGVDASGNGNNFNSINFNVGNTSQVWSDYGINDDVDYNWRLAFNGKLGTTYNDGVTQDGNASDYCKFIPPGGIVAQKSLRLYHISGPSANMFVVSGGNDTFINYPDTQGWANPNITYPYNLEEIRIGNQGNTWTYLMAVEVDGELLVDGNIRDTVMDTPMNNYPVLKTINGGGSPDSSSVSFLTNGDLEVAEGGNGEYAHYVTKFGFTSNQYYAEFVVPKEIGDGADRRAYFGINTNPNTSYHSTTGSVVMFNDGNLNYNGLTTPPGSGEAWSPGDIIGCSYNVPTKTATWFKNGEYQADYTTDFDSANPARFNVSIWQCTGGLFNAGQQPFAGSNVIDNGDGTVTLPSEIPNTSQVWSDNARTTSDGTTDLNWTDLPNLFDGDLTTYAHANLSPSIGGPCVVIQTFDPPISVIDGFTVYGVIFNNAITASATIVINDDVSTTTAMSKGPASDSPYAAATTVKFTGSISKVTITKTSNDASGMYLYGYAADKSILIDTDPTQNTDQVWSSNITGSWNSSYPPSVAFNNDIVNPGTYSTGGLGTIEFDGLGPATSIRLYGTAGVSNTSWRIVTDQGESSPITWPGNSTGSWHDVTISGSATLIRISNYDGSGQLRAVEIDGRVLVDSQGFPGGIFKKLHQTWTEQQAVFFKSELSRLGNYELALRSAAAAYVNSGSFDTGAIVKHDGEIWQAIVDNAESVTPSENESATWKRLNLSE